MSDQTSGARQRQTKVGLHANATAEALMLTAERLWGERGIEGVSLREISSEADCSNKSAVAYHFGDRDGLIAAVFKARLPSIQASRAPLFAAAEARGELDDTEKLLTLLFLPISCEVDSNGRRTYAAFLRALIRFRVNRNRAFEEHTPLAYRLFDLLRQKISHIQQRTYDARMRLILELCLSAIVNQDDGPNRRRAASGLGEQLFRDAVSAAAYLLSLPEQAADARKTVLSDSTRTHLGERA